VVFTDGVNVITPKPNLTVTSYFDGSALYTDSQGNRAFYPSDFVYPTSSNFSNDTSSTQQATSPMSSTFILNGFYNKFTWYDSGVALNLP